MNSSQLHDFSMLSGLIAGIILIFLGVNHGPLTKLKLIFFALALGFAAPFVWQLASRVHPGHTDTLVWMIGVLASLFILCYMAGLWIHVVYGLGITRQEKKTTAYVSERYGQRPAPVDVRTSSK